MARCCGSTGSCSCKIEAGPHVSVDGLGSSQDPFVISSDVSFAVEDNSTFDVILQGAGTLESPWTLSVRYSGTARLADIPDVVADDDIPNGDVLLWDSGTQTWKPGAPTTAAAGSVTTDTSLAGDGSVGAPLQVREDAARFLASTAAGLGISDDGLQLLVRQFPDAATRAAATPVPAEQALSSLRDTPGRIDYWDGAEWTAITNGLALAVQDTAELLALSGTYAGGTVTQFVDQISVLTDGSGNFDVLSTDFLGDYAGVLDVKVQPKGTIPWVCMVNPGTDKIVGTAYRLDTGAPYIGVTVAASVAALLY